MGLDSYWRIKVKDSEGKDAWVANGNVRPKMEITAVCGGMFSGHGAESFRGKVYNEAVENISGESLYVEEMPPETVRKVAQALLAAGPQALLSYGLSEEEAEQFIEMWRANAAAESYLLGWW